MSVRPFPAPLLERLPAGGRAPVESFRVSVVVPVYNERHVVAASVRRLLALQHPLIGELEVIAVDDCSTDGTWDVLQALAAEDGRLTALRHDRNRGKGAAVRTALERCTGDITVVHDADLEYDPSDIPALLVPFAREGADAVLGSRYLAAAYRRALMHRHTLVNKGLTALSNWFTDLHLTDVETCYKAVNTTLLKSIPLRSDDFRFEVEIVAKLAKRRARVFETPIRYVPRSHADGKKIGAMDGLRALGAMLHYWLIDDLYQQDQYGSHILVELERATRFNVWLGRVLRPYLGDRVLEIGAGIGTLTNQFIPRELYVASDINPHYLRYLDAYAVGKPYLRALKVDAADPHDFRDLQGEFDTALIVNVLEHVEAEQQTLRNLHSALLPGGRVVVLVPQHAGLMGSLDLALGHLRRYDPARLGAALAEAGFSVERIFDFNRVSVPGWWLNGRVLRRKRFSRVQLKALDTAMPVLSRLDRLWPWKGLSLIAVGRKA